jgi:hypothetical protein
VAALFVRCALQNTRGLCALQKWVCELKLSRTHETWRLEKEEQQRVRIINLTNV